MLSLKPEYCPAASQCQTSTIASLSGVHWPFAICLTLKVRTSGAPGFTTLVLGSTRMSERSSCLSRKYGPTVSSGLATHAGSAAVDVLAVLTLDALSPNAALDLPLGL